MKPTWAIAPGRAVSVWLDDVRPMPDTYDVHVRTAEQVIDLVKTGFVYCLSLDNDLGDGYTPGYKVVDWLEAAIRCGTLDVRQIPSVVHVHSSNPVAKARMGCGLLSCGYERLVIGEGYYYAAKAETL